MEDLVKLASDGFVEITANLGLLALAALGVSYFRLIEPLDRNQANPRHGLVIGLLMGGVAAALMYVPIPLQPGVFGDGRGAPILLSGMVGGPVAAAVTALIAAANRLLIGGLGAPTGVAYIAVFATAGVAWRLFVFCRRNRNTTITEIAGLAAAASLASTPVVLLMPEAIAWKVLTEIWPPMTVVTVIGAVILGSLLRRETVNRDLMLALEQEKMAAEQARQAKSTFLAHMSHELRTPLNAILGFSDLIAGDRLQRGVDPRYRAYAEDIALSGQHLLSLLNDILDLSKVEAGRYQVSLEPVSSEDLWSLPLATLNMLAEDKRITLNTDETTIDHRVRADLRALQQCILNVVGNAIKYTPIGGTVTCRMVTRGDNVEIEIDDTGPGIPEEDQERVLQPFEQVAGPGPYAKLDGSGTGLGLSITRSLVQLMGGTLDLRTLKNQKGSVIGTRVTVALPSEPPGVETGNQRAANDPRGWSDRYTVRAHWSDTTRAPARAAAARSAAGRLPARERLH